MPRRPLVSLLAAALLLVGLALVGAACDAGGGEGSAGGTGDVGGAGGDLGFATADAGGSSNPDEPGGGVASDDPAGAGGGDRGPGEPGDRGSGSDGAAGGPAGDAERPTPGSLRFVEVMQNPAAVSDQDGEWFELHNASAEALDLTDCILESADDSPHTIAAAAPVIIPAGAYAAFGRNASLEDNGGVELAYVYAGLDLTNGTDSLTLRCGVDVIDTLDFGGPAWPTGSGASLQLDLAAVPSGDTHDAASWCAGKTVFGAGDRGTPGTTNVFCSTACDGVVCDSPPPPSCDGGSALQWVAQGTCTEGICGYELASTTPCNANQICKQGECILQGSATPPPPPGALVLTEIMANPSAVPDDQGEWFELVSVAGATVDLTGCRLESTNDDGHLIDPGAEWLIDPGQRVVLGALADTALNGGVPVDYAYGDGVRLANTADTLTLTCAGLVVDEVTWGPDLGFPAEAGASMQLTVTPSTSANDLGASWCAAVAPYGSGDLGTPGADNGSCEGGDPGDPEDPQDPGDPTLDPDWPAPGEVAITELMANPAAVPDADGEWFELTHLDGGPHDLHGCVLSTYSASHTIDDGSSFGIAPGAILVFATDSDTTLNGGLSVDYDYTALNLKNSDGSLSLRCGDVLIASAQWTGSSSGVSLQLDAEGHWCDADPEVASYGDGDAGSPGLPNPACPAPPEPLGDTPAPGEVIFTEVMQNPAAVGDASGEWFELTNLTALDLDLTGCVLSGTNDSDHTVTALGMLAGAHVVIAKKGDPTVNGGVSADYTWSGVTLGNGEDSLSLTCDGLLIDAVAWDDGATFPDPNGASMQLGSGSHDAADNDTGASWCEASTPFGAGDLGTPGAPNGSCF